jgi:hypothetical protein
MSKWRMIDEALPAGAQPEVWAMLVLTPFGVALGSVAGSRLTINERQSHLDRVQSGYVLSLLFKRLQSFFVCQPELAQHLPDGGAVDIDGMRFSQLATSS